jgi:hypothetical protein
MGNSMEAPQKLKIELPYHPAISLLGIYLKECKSGYNKGSCTPIFIAAFFTKAKLWKQLRCPSTDEWIKTMWYLYTMEFYSDIRKNEILLFADKWMEMKNIILRDANQFQQVKSHVFFHMWNDASDIMKNMTC